MASKRGRVRAKRGELAILINAQAEAIDGAFQMLAAAAPQSLEKIGWTEVIRLADEVSNQATVAGMVWSGDEPSVESLKENITAYFNTLHGFILICYGSTAGSGPTLHEFIHNSAKAVVDSSLSFFKESVMYYESRNRNPGWKQKVPQLSGAIWEACAAVKKCPSTNFTAIGRAMTQVGVLLQDIVREMQELPLHAEAASAADGLSNVIDNGSCSLDKEEASSDFGGDDDFEYGDFGFNDDLSPGELAIARLVQNVALESLAAVKELIRYITGLMRTSGDKNSIEDGKVELMEDLLANSNSLASHVNDLAASVYPPQDAIEMSNVIRDIHGVINRMRDRVAGLGGSPESAVAAFHAIDKSLEVLEYELNGDLVADIDKLSV